MGTACGRGVADRPAGVTRERMAGNQRTDLSLVTGDRRILGYDNLGGWPGAPGTFRSGPHLSKASCRRSCSTRRGRNAPLHVVASPRHEPALRGHGGRPSHRSLRHARCSVHLPCASSSIAARYSSAIPLLASTSWRSRASSGTRASEPTVHLPLDVTHSAGSSRDVAYRSRTRCGPRLLRLARGLPSSCARTRRRHSGRGSSRSGARSSSCRRGVGRPGWRSLPWLACSRVLSASFPRGPCSRSGNSRSPERMRVRSVATGTARTSWRRVTVATFESAYRHMDRLGNRFDLLVVDEAHHFGCGLRDEALEMSIADARLGLTATPPQRRGGRSAACRARRPDGVRAHDRRPRWQLSLALRQRDPAPRPDRRRAPSVRALDDDLSRRAWAVSARGAPRDLGGLRARRGTNDRRPSRARRLPSRVPFGCLHGGQARDAPRAAPATSRRAGA